MKKRTVCLCLGTLAAVSLLWAADFNPDGTKGNVGQTFRSATGGEEISCLPEFNPNDPYYLELVEKLHRARESGDRQLAESIMKRIEEFTGAEWTHTKYEDMDKDIIFEKPESVGQGFSLAQKHSEPKGSHYKGYEWENVKIYDANQNNANYGDIGSSSNSYGSGDTLYAVFDEWDDIMNVWGIRIFRSTDGGENWFLSGGFVSAEGKDLRYPTIAVTKSGEVLIAYFVDNDTGNDWVKVCKYTPSKGDYNFTIASDPTKNVCGYRPKIVVNYGPPFSGPNYYIYVAYQTKEGAMYYLKIARSTDQNISYSYHVTIASSISIRHRSDLMFIDNDEASGDYLLFAYPYNTTEIHFKRSIDYGDSWSSGASISVGDTVYYPTIGGVNQTDSLFCAWMMKTDDGRWGVYGRYSGDRAESWSDTNIPIFVPDSGDVSKPVIQERTFGNKYYITASYWPRWNSCQVLVGYADVMAPDVWNWDMLRDTSVYQVDCAPRIVTHNYEDGYKPAIVWSDGRDGTHDYYFGKRLPANDIASTEIYWPLWCIVNPETTATPYAKIKNVGEVDVTDVPVVFGIINLLDYTDFYIDTSFISLPIGDSVVVYFDDWTSGVHPTSYYALVYTLLDGDIEPGNDRVETWFTACNRKIEDGWGTPTLDGILDTVGEWGNACKIDISDTRGWSGGPNAPLSCILYTLNDSGNLYLGIDYKADNSLEEEDKLIFQFDEDHNGEWASDSSEGWYAFYYPDSLFYQSLAPSPWTQINPSGFEVASALITGRLTYEIKLPLGPEKTDLTTNLGDVMGFFVAAYDKSESDFGGWYPQDWHPEAPDIFSPEYMADLKLAEGVGIEEPEEQLPEFALKILGSNPIGSKVSISFSIPERAKVKLSVYDLSGRLVNRLADGVFATGIHKVSWKPVLSNGVYFIRLENGTRTVTKKVVLLR